MRRRWFGIVILCGAGIFSLLFSLISTRNALTFWILVSITLFFLVGVGYSVKLDLQKQFTRASIANVWMGTLFVAIGGFLTYTMITLLDFHSVLASAIVGILAHFLITKYEAEAFCGSFAGMTTILMFRPLEMVLVVLTVALVYGLATHAFKGFGGKLGTIAFAGSIPIFFLLGNTFSSAEFQAAFWVIGLVAMLGAVSTYLLQHIIHFSAVFSSALLGLSFALLGLYVFKLPPTYIAGFYGATFVGMADRKVIPNVGLAAISGIMFGIIFDRLYPFLNGTGGKLGMMAFLSVLSVFGMLQVVRAISNQWKRIKR